jgi:hypothetical protein
MACRDRAPLDDDVRVCKLIRHSFSVWGIFCKNEYRNNPGCSILSVTEMAGILITLEYHYGWADA